MPDAIYMPVEVDQIVDVGGCVGKIIKVLHSHVLVSGTYHYSDGEDSGNSESWDFIYKKEDLIEITDFRTTWEKVTIWDISSVKPVVEAGEFQ